MAQVKFIGRTTSFKGKRLFDILCRLKDFGVGRIVYRNRFFERYPEPSYFVITKVEPDMTDPTQAHIDYKVKSIAHGTKIFRGESRGESEITKGYKNDWRLVPRDAEQTFLSYSEPKRPLNIVPDRVKFPPLLELLIIEEQRRAGTYTGEPPMLPLQIKKTSRAVFESAAKKAVATDENVAI